ncbi:hypothetical protein NU09_2936 [Flavobacterium beibuense]|uniref:Uncharacterized protein n=1 Tax=Flavobacterium beibuense TaxID=657326 RepID=A0A444W717_9FLAO|nr:hypothetical protein NU09_2936 [Flavobacterium beibuense]
MEAYPSSGFSGNTFIDMNVYEGKLFMVFLKVEKIKTGHAMEGRHVRFNM